MIVCENRALSECIRDRCKRTVTGWVLQTDKKIQFQNNLLLSYCLPVLLLRTLVHEFARISQVIIHAVIKSKKLPDPTFN